MVLQGKKKIPILNSLMYKDRSNKSGIVVITPPFGKKDDYSWSDRRYGMLGIYAITFNPVRCVYDSLGAR